MTERDEKDRMIFRARIAKVTGERIELDARVIKCTPGQLMDMVFEEFHNRLIADGKVRQYLTALQSLDGEQVLE